MAPLTAACIATVAAIFVPVLGDPVHILEQDLYALLGVERGKVGECLPNKDKKTGRITSWDCGPFQINSSNGPELARIFGTTAEDAMRRVTDGGCLNAHVTGWLLIGKRRAGGGNRREALGRHNSATPHIKEADLERLESRRQRLFGTEAIPGGTPAAAHGEPGIASSGEMPGSGPCGDEGRKRSASQPGHATAVP